MHVATAARPPDRHCNEPGCQRRAALDRAYCREHEAAILARAFGETDDASPLIDRRLQTYVGGRSIA